MSFYSDPLKWLKFVLSKYESLRRRGQEVTNVIAESSGCGRYGSVVNYLQETWNNNYSEWLWMVLLSDYGWHWVIMDVIKWLWIILSDYGWYYSVIMDDTEWLWMIYQWMMTVVSGCVAWLWTVGTQYNTLIHSITFSINYKKRALNIKAAIVWQHAPACTVLHVQSVPQWDICTSVMATVLYTDWTGY